MNPELEAIISAYTAHLENPRDKNLFEIFRSRIDDVCEKTGVDRLRLEAAIKKKYTVILKQQSKNPPTLPPKA